MTTHEIAKCIVLVLAVICMVFCVKMVKVVASCIPGTHSRFARVVLVIYGAVACALGVGAIYGVWVALS